MPRKRMIDPSFWTDEKLGECTRDERLLFMGLISNADDEGYGRANPKLLRSSIFPYDDLRVSDLDKWLSRLGGFGLIVLYQVKGQTYYYLPNFPRYQTINRPTPSSIPKPDEDSENTLTEDSLSAHGGLTEDSRLKEIEEKRKEKKHMSSGDDISAPANYPSIVEAFNGICKSLPKVRGLTDQRRKAIRRTARQVEEAGGFPALFEKVEASDFLTGRSGNWNGCGFDWILKPANLTKILEGNYDNRQEEPDIPTVYAYPRPEDDHPVEIPDGAELADILPPAEEAAPW